MIKMINYNNNNYNNKSILTVLLVVIALVSVFANAQYSVTIESVSPTSAVYGQPVLVVVRVRPTKDLSRTPINTNAAPIARTAIVTDDQGIECTVTNFIDDASTARSDALGNCTLIGSVPGQRTIVATLLPCVGDALTASAKLTIAPLTAHFTQISSSPNPTNYVNSPSTTIRYTLTTNGQGVFAVPVGRVFWHYGPYSGECTYNGGDQSMNACVVRSITSTGSFVVALEYVPLESSPFPYAFATYQQGIDLGMAISATSFPGSNDFVARTPLNVSFSILVTSTGSNRLEVRGTVQVQSGSAVACSAVLSAGAAVCNGTFTSLNTALRYFNIAYLGDDEVHQAFALQFPVRWTPDTIRPTLPLSDPFDGTQASTRLSTTGTPLVGLWFPDNTASLSVGGDRLWQRTVPQGPVINGGSNAWNTKFDVSNAATADVSLYSPIFDLSTVTGTVVFSGDFWFDLRSSLDLVRIDYAFNGGAWTNLNGGADINWYTSPAGWSVSTTQYVRVAQEIPSAAGKSAVQLRVVYSKGASNTDNAVSFDNFLLTNQAITLPVLVSSSTPVNGAIRVRLASSRNAGQTGGSIAVNVGGSCSATLTSGAGSCSVAGLTAGVRTVTLSFTSSDPLFASSTNTYTNSFGVLANTVLTAAGAGSETFDDFESNANLRWFNGRDSRLERAFELGLPSSGLFSDAYSGVNAWATNLEGLAPQETGLIVDLQSGGFDLSAVPSGNAFVGAVIWYELKGQEVTLEYTVDAGSTWLVVSTAANSLNWFDSATAWTGSSVASFDGAGWRQVYNRLPAAVFGKVFQLRYVYSAASGVDRTEGVVVDDLRVMVTRVPTLITHTVPVYAVSGVTQTVRISVANVITPGTLPNGTVSVALSGNAPSGTTFATTCNNVALNNSVAQCTVTFTGPTSSSRIKVAITYTPTTGQAFASSATYVVTDVRPGSVLLASTAYPVKETFDNENATAAVATAWRTYGPSAFGVGKPSGEVLIAAASAPNAWSTVPPPAGTSGSTLAPLVVFVEDTTASPIYDFTGVAAASPVWVRVKLSLDVWQATQNDGAWLEASIGGAAFLPISKYNVTNSVNWTPASITGGLPVWRSNPGGTTAGQYFTALRQVPAGGSTVQFRMRFRSNSVYAAPDGVAFDDFEVAPGAIESTIKYVPGPFNEMNDAVTLTFTLSSAVNRLLGLTGPLGTVIVRQGSTVLGSVSTSSTGVATLTVSPDSLSSQPIVWDFRSSTGYEEEFTGRLVMNSYDLVSQLPYSDSFESASASTAPRWNPDSLTGVWKLGTPVGARGFLNGASSGSKAWYTAPGAGTGFVAQGSYSLTSPVFNLTSISSPVYFTAMIKHLLIAGNGLSFKLRTKVNAGSAWQVETLPIPSNTFYWNKDVTGTRLSFVRTAVRLTNAAGRYAQLSLTYNSINDTAFSEGFVLDDVLITTQQPVGVSITTPTDFVVGASSLFNYTLVPIEAVPINKTTGVVTVSATGLATCSRTLNVNSSNSGSCGPYTWATAGVINVLVSYAGDSVYLPSSDIVPINVYNLVRPTFPVFDSFESPAITDAWVAAGVPLFQRGQPRAIGAYSGTNAWTTTLSTAVGTNTQLSYLVSPVFNLQNATGSVYFGGQLWYRLSSSVLTAEIRIAAGGAWSTFADAQGIRWTNPWSGLSSENVFSQVWAKLPAGAVGSSFVQFRFSFAQTRDLRDGATFDDFQLVRRTPTKISATAVTLAQVGTRARVKFSVSSPYTGVIPAGNVSVTVTGTNGDSCRATLTNGAGQCFVTLSPSSSLVFLRIEYEGQDTTFEASTLTLPVVAFYTVKLDATDLPYIDDFEGSRTTTAPWIPETGLWELGTPTKRVLSAAASGTKAWATSLTGEYSNFEDSAIFSPLFDLTSFEENTPFFVGARIRASSQVDVDGTVLEVRYNDEEDWFTVGTKFDELNWYTCGSGNGQWCNTGVNSFTPALHLVREAGRKFVQFRYRFVSDGLLTGEGFVFDDFLLATSFPVEIEVLSAQPNPVRVQSSVTTQFRIRSPPSRVTQYYPLQGIVRVSAGSGEECHASVISSPTAGNEATGGCRLQLLSPGARELRFDLCTSMYYSQNRTTRVINVMRAAATIDVTRIRSASASHIRGPSVVNTPSEVSILVQRYVSDSDGPYPSGTVVITDASGATCRTTIDSNGAGTCTLTFTQAGESLLSVAYLGDQLFEPTAASVPHTVLPVVVFDPKSNPLVDSLEGQSTWKRDSFFGYSVAQRFPGLENFWKLGKPNGVVINKAASGNNAWYTDFNAFSEFELSGNVANLANLHVYSPAYNMSLLNRGDNVFFGANVWYNSNEQFFTRVEVSVNRGQWKVLGHVDEGINWYNRKSVEPGWLGTDLRNYVPAFHQLTTADQQIVQLRFQFNFTRANPGLLMDGFAFDDPTISLTAPTNIVMRLPVTPIPFGSRQLIAFGVESASRSVPRGTLGVTLGDGQTCTGALDAAGELRCNLTFSQTTSRDLSATYVPSLPATVAPDAGITWLAAVPVESVVQLTNATVNPYRNTFEANSQPGDWWAVDSVGDNLFWKVQTNPTTGTTSGTKAWATSQNLLRSAVTATLTSPRFNFTSVNFATIVMSMQISYNLRPEDSLVVQVSTNNGAWTTISSSSIRLTGPFFGDNAQRFVDVHYSFARPSFAQFRVTYTSDRDLTASAVAVDDFQLSPQFPINVAVVQPTPAVIGETQLYNFTLTRPLGGASNPFNGTVRVYEGQTTSATLCTGTLLGTSGNFVCNITLTGAARFVPLRVEYASNDAAVFSNYPSYLKPYPAVQSVVLLNSSPRYTDNFEVASSAAWVANELWTKGTPSGVLIKGAASGTQAWFTNFDKEPERVGTYSLYSPVFDLRNITASSTIHFGSSVWWHAYNTSGARLEMLVEQPIGVAPTWTTVGAVNDPYHWYNGPSALWSSSGLRRTEYTSAFHPLASAATKRVQLRITWSVDSVLGNNEGFAFDNFAIGVQIAFPTELRIDNIYAARPQVGRSTGFWYSVLSPYVEPPTIAGTVEVRSDTGVVCTDTVNQWSGVGLCNSTFASAGTRSFTFTYTPGDNLHLPSTASVLAVDVVDYPSDVLFLNPVPNESIVGQEVEFAVIVRSFDPASEAPEGTVSIKDSLSSGSCSGTLVSGRTRCVLSFSGAGVRTVTASYTPSGSTTVRSTQSTPFTVYDNLVAVTFINPTPSLTGVPVSVSFRVSSTSIPTVHGGAIVTSDREGVLCSVGVVNNVGTCSLPLTAIGWHTLTVQFFPANKPLLWSTFGQARHRVDERLTSYTNITVAPSSVVVTNNALVTAEVRINDGSLPTGGVRFEIDGKVVCASSPFDRFTTYGFASCLISKQLVAKPGTFTVTAFYPATTSTSASTPVASSNTATLVVVPAVTTVTATSSPNPSDESVLRVAVSATVTTNTNQPLLGRLTVLDELTNERCIARSLKDATMPVTCLLDMAIAGVHPITVRYSEDLVNPAAEFKFNHVVNEYVPTPDGTLPSPTPSPTPVPPNPNGENGPTVQQALLLPGAALGQISNLQSSRIFSKRSVLGTPENNAFRSFVVQVLNLVTTQHVGVDDVLQNPFQFVLVTDQGRDGRQLIRELKTLVDINDDRIRGTMLEGASITLLTPDPPAPNGGEFPVDPVYQHEVSSSELVPPVPTPVPVNAAIVALPSLTVAMLSFVIATLAMLFM